MMIQRTLWAFGMLFLFLVPILIEPMRFAFPVVLTAFSALTTYELVGLLHAKGLRVSFGLSILILALLAADAWMAGLSHGLYILALYFVILMVDRVVRQDFDNVAAEAGAALLAAIYVGLPTAMAIELMMVPTAAGEFLGRYHMLFLIAVVFSGDSAAYIFGSRFGRRKFFPLISPKKSLEGAIASVVTSLLAALICLLVSETLRRAYGWIPGLTLGALLGLAAPIGDLAESLFKRDAKVKDSSHLIAGHGGFLDVFDALMFCLPIQYVFWRLLLA